MRLPQETCDAEPSAAASQYARLNVPGHGQVFPSHRAWLRHHKLLLFDLILVAYTLSLAHGCARPHLLTILHKYCSNVLLAQRVSAPRKVPLSNPARLQARNDSPLPQHPCGAASNSLGHKVLLSDAWGARVVSATPPRSLTGLGLLR